MALKFELGDAVEIVKGALKGKLGNVIGRFSSSGNSGISERYTVELLDTPKRGESVLGIFDLSELNQLIAKTESPKACACDSRDLMNYGCKCGAFIREVFHANAS